MCQFPCSQLPGGRVWGGEVPVDGDLVRDADPGQEGERRPPAGGSLQGEAAGRLPAGERKGGNFKSEEVLKFPKKKKLPQKEAESVLILNLELGRAFKTRRLFWSLGEFPKKKKTPNQLLSTLKRTFSRWIRMLSLTFALFSFFLLWNNAFSSTNQF